MSRSIARRVWVVGALCLGACGGSDDAPAQVSGDVDASASGSGAGGQPEPSTGVGGAGVGVGGSGVLEGGAPPTSVTDGAGGSAEGSVGPDAASSSYGDSGLPDPGTEGDGDRIIGPNYTRSPLVQAQGTTPKGKRISFNMQGTDSTIYKGVNGNYQRGVTIYVPQQYVPGTPAPLIVTQDAMGQDVLPNALDNLIDAKKLPKIVVFFVNNGGGDAQGSQRGLEYDTVSGLFAEFIDKEVLPRGIAEVKKQLNIDLKITTDPEGRGTFGGSSGGAASFSMAWWHPDLFRRVISYSGTFVSQVKDGSPFPHGCWVYHDVDPHFVEMTEAPAGLIVQRCQAATGDKGSSNPGPCDTPLSQATCEAVTGCVWKPKEKKPVRAWLESADADLGTPGHELDPKYGTKPYRDFDIANQRMAAALRLAGYHYHYDHAMKAGHVDGNVVGQTLPEALLWVWRGYPID